MAKSKKVTVARRLKDGMVFPLTRNIRSRIPREFEEAQIVPGKGTDCLDDNHKPIDRREYAASKAGLQRNSLGIPTNKKIESTESLDEGVPPPPIEVVTEDTLGLSDLDSSSTRDLDEVDTVTEDTLGISDLDDLSSGIDDVDK